MTAKHGEDFKGDRGIVTFENGETEKNVCIEIVQTPDKEPDETFRVVLAEVSEGAQLGHTKDSIVTIIGDAEFASMINRVVAKTHIAMGKVIKSNIMTVGCPKPENLPPFFQNCK
jgi:hypothetical protein